MLKLCHYSVSIYICEWKKLGLYTQVEQVDKLFFKRYYKNNDCNLYKASNDDATPLYHSVNQSAYEAEYALETNETINEWGAFLDFITVLNNTPDSLLLKQLVSALMLKTHLSTLRLK